MERTDGYGSREGDETVNTWVWFGVLILWLLSIISMFVAILWAGSPPYQAGSNEKRRGT